MKILNKSFLLAMMLPLTGCGTLMTLDQPEVYSGVQEDVSRLTFSKTAPAGDVSRLTFSKTAPAGDVGEAFGTILFYPFIIIDVPLSFVGDTLMLPVKGIQKLSQD